MEEVQGRESWDSVMSGISRGWSLAGLVHAGYWGMMNKGSE